MSTALLQVESQIKFDKYINLNKDIVNEQSNNDDFVKVVKRKGKAKNKRSMAVVSSNKESSTIKGVPRLMDLHVYGWILKQHVWN